jgi:vanillate O-demethylase ferredoxin subunit
VETLRVRVKSATWEAENILSLELRPVDGAILPPFTAGAHIDLQLPSGLGRSYSLINPQSERHRYVIAVQNDRASRGGSRYLHDGLRVGDVLTITPPRNDFALVEDARHVVLIAGGIGITPLWAMVQRLGDLGRSFELHYAVRTRAQTAFIEPLTALMASGGRVDLHVDDETSGAMLDLGTIIARAGADAHLYCCGPAAMLGAFEAATADRPRDRVHVEYFTSQEPAATEGGYVVELARSGRVFTVKPGKTILETLLDAGLEPAHSCREGVCGTCETTVLHGVPDHRDMVLTDAEHAANRTMMICCSGCKGDRLVLDL